MRVIFMFMALTSGCLAAAPEAALRAVRAPPSLPVFSAWTRTATAPRAKAARRRLEAMVPARDGALLRTVVYLPVGDAARPALLLRTPYLEPASDGGDPGVFSGMADYYTARGYAVVFQSIRGKYGSQGSYQLFSTAEVDDAASLLDWMVAQSWCNGRVAAHGVSHDGFDALAAACTNHPALKLVIAGGAPAAAWSDAFLKNGTVMASTLDYLRYQEQNSGAPFTPGFNQLYLDKTAGHGDAAAHDALLYGHDIKLWDGLLAALEEPASAYWSERQILDRLTATRMPIVHVAGWHTDGDMPDVFRNYLHLVKRPGGPLQRLLVGWWSHGQSGPYLDPMKVMQPYLRERYDAYLAHALKGEASPFLDEAPVHVFAQGRNEWIAAPRWPLREVTPRTLHLAPGAADGQLAAAMPTSHVSLTFRTDPASAEPSGLAFYTEKLDADLQLMGPVVVHLTLASQARDMDVFAVLFRPDAPAAPDSGFNLFGGMRTRFRGGQTAPVSLLSPGEPFRVKLAFGPLGHRLEAGERLGLWVTGGMPGSAVANAQTGLPIAGAQGVTAAEHTLLIGPGLANRVQIYLLP